MNVKEYESAEQTLRARTDACRLAVDALGTDGLEQHGTGRLMALCVFFESYIAHGATWTDKHFKLFDEPKSADLHAIAGGKL